MSLDAARALLARLPGWQGRAVDLRQGVVPMASPMNQGVDAASLRAIDSATGESLWLKLPHPDAALFADPKAASEAARIAGELGVGPMILASDPETGALAMTDHSATHKTATLDRLADPAIRDAILAVRKKLHAGPRFPRTTSIFADIRALREAASGLPLPQDHAWLFGNAEAAEAAIAASGIDTVPAHGDGNASNVLVAEDKSVLLVDYDLAANRDPFEDLGSFLAEAHPFDPEARETFEAFHGHHDERLFNRARLYGTIDDLRWGLIGAILAATSERNDLEFLKYADWRFLRCRFAMRDPRFEERVRRV